MVVESIKNSIFLTAEVQVGLNSDMHFPKIKSHMRALCTDYKQRGQWGIPCYVVLLQPLCKYVTQTDYYQFQYISQYYKIKV